MKNRETKIKRIPDLQFLNQLRNHSVYLINSAQF